MRGQRLVFVLVISALAAGIVFGQPGRGGSQWRTAFGDAQRTSWIRTDDKISVAALTKPGFALQWTAKLDNEPRGIHGLGQGVTANGVTLFVPMSIVTGSSNAVYGIDNDIGYVVWERRFEAPLPPATPECAGGITSAATRIVNANLSAGATAPGSGGGRGRGIVGYRSLLGQPGEGVPVEGARGRGRSGDPSGVPAPPAGGGRAAAPAEGARGRAGRGAPPRGADAAPIPAARPGEAAEYIPGAPRREEGAPVRTLFRPSGVSYVVSSDGMLHVLGLPSGKDMQRPAPFLPANAKWSAPVAVGTMLYAATSGKCGGAPSAVWGIDLDSEAKPVVSWKTNGGDVVGAVAFTSEGTLIAAVGPGQAAGEGKANAIVALDPKTLQLKGWFSQPGAEFVTGPTILRVQNREVIAAATKDGRIVLLDASSLGGADGSKPLLVSKPFLDSGATVNSDALAAWRQSGAPAKPEAAAAGSVAQEAPAGTAWLLVPMAGRPAAGTPATNGAISAGAVIALKVTQTGGRFALEPGWTTGDLSSPATPLIVNGVVFALATGRPSTATGKGGPAVLHAYDGATGAPLWNSGGAMATVASPGSLWSGLGQIYVGMQDGTLHAFGFNDERSHTSVAPK